LSTAGRDGSKNDTPVEVGKKKKNCPVKKPNLEGKSSGGNKYMKEKAEKNERNPHKGVSFVGGEDSITPTNVYQKRKHTKIAVNLANLKGNTDIGLGQQKKKGLPLWVKNAQKT